MANTFIPKRSTVAGKVPLPADLQIGELAVNLADRKIYTKDANSAVVQLNQAAGVDSFNTRTGAVTLTGTDVMNALTASAGGTFTGQLTVQGTTQADNIGMVRAMNTSGTAGQGGYNASCYAQNNNFGVQMMAWENYGARIGNRTRAAGSGDGSLYLVAGNDMVMGTLSHAYGRCGFSNGNVTFITSYRGDGVLACKGIYAQKSSLTCDVDDVKAHVQIQFCNPNGVVGSITTIGVNTYYNTASDYRLKENVQPMPSVLDKIAKLRLVEYTWKMDGSPGQGFIAHELQEVFPFAVTGEKDATKIENYEIEPGVPPAMDAEGNVIEPGKPPVIGQREVPVYQGVDTSFLVPILAKAIQEQQAIIDALTKRLDAAGL